MDHKMDPVIHFELPTNHPDRSGRFYGQAFGWRIVPLGPDMGGFVLAFTVESDAQTRVPTKPGAINGGFFERTSVDQHIRLTILVDDIRDAIERVTAAGGTALGDPVELPGVGLFASFSDPVGNVLTLNQDYAVKNLQ